MGERTQALREAQEDLLRSERLATVASMMGAVAHEIRNPLGVIEQSAQVLERLAGDVDERIAASCARIRRGIERCVGFIDVMNSYSGVDRVSRAPISPGEWLNSLRGRLREPEGVVLTVRCEAGAEMNVDAAKLSFAVEHVVNNAFEALAHTSGGLVELMLTEQQDGFLITVEDNGPGLDENVRLSALEPFVTTKAMHHGLGLSFVKEAIAQHGGHTDLVSRPGGGTSVRMTIRADD